MHLERFVSAQRIDGREVYLAALLGHLQVASICNLGDLEPEFRSEFSAHRRGEGRSSNPLHGLLRRAYLRDGAVNLTSLFTGHQLERAPGMVEPCARQTIR
jgi:hypothetical protein